jgi:para-aminobenzoate synthetase component 1
VNWTNRICHQDPNTATIDALRSDDNVLEFVNPHDFSFYPQGPVKFDRLLGAGIHREFIGSSEGDFHELKKWLSAINDFAFGHFTYELKDLLESLRSKQQPRVEFPMFRFFVPQHVAILNEGEWRIHSHAQLHETVDNKTIEPFIGTTHSGATEEMYLSKVQSILRHIQHGDIYETNFCIEHFADHSIINPPLLFEQMVRHSIAPFSCRLAHGGKHLLCASPERFMAKEGNRVFSQPMKGTNRRQPDNAAAMEALRNNPKERAENIMITDLVRNDLSKFAKRGSVMVDELCGVYPFAHVNQMVSTVSCELREDAHPLDMLLGAFPMGSMTGAPKVRAMQLMEEYEGFGRGLFSGSVGYFTPDLDFDFNVVIRSILYDEHSGNLSFPTGSAITINSDPELEWEECQLKAEAMRRLLKEHAGKNT